MGNRAVRWSSSLIGVVALGLAHVACDGLTESGPGGSSGAPAPPLDCTDCGPGAACWVSKDHPDCPASRTCRVSYEELTARRLDDPADGGPASDAGDAIPIPVELTLAVTSPEDRGTSFASEVTCQGCTIIERHIGRQDVRLVVDVTAKRATLGLRFECMARDAATGGTLAVRIIPTSSGVDIAPFELSNDP